jgi:copper chaperone CopZ
MAGQYFYDPRPFYMQPGDYKLISLDDCFVQQKGQGDKGGKPGGEDKGKGKEGEGNKKKEPEKPKVQTIEVRVNLCCDNCVSKVRRKFEDVEGVEKVDCCQWTKRVIVRGTVKPEVVLKKVRKVKKDADLITPPKK